MKNGKRPARRASKRSRLGFWRVVLIALALAFAVSYSLIVFAILCLRFVDPPTTAVQIERRWEAVFAGEPYTKRYRFVPLAQISPSLQKAVIAAEDSRFFVHHGFDWKEMHSAMENDLEGGKPRGASTITQQLDRNLFLSTGRSILRKAVEFTLVPPTEFLLSKHRILELYLNVIEYGPGMYGCEAASRVYFHRAASALTADEAAQLAALLPAPLHRRPGQPAWYVERIRRRMDEVVLPR